MPPPNSVPNNYSENRNTLDRGDGAVGEEAIPLKQTDHELNLDDAPLGSTIV